MNTFVNPDMLNIVTHDKIAGMQRDAEIANQAKLCWAIRFISFHLPRPDYSGKAARVKRQTPVVQS
ncbi:MAG: hypothetical protein J0I20_24525 [Chloroflexi bacterium]|nr:hypothetical protein [Chloroflexota bacterium]OJV99745.1 MAG: hypothetical protein BGO39_12405 [Chloroflexi bacterium 54-19]